jgi:5,10-methylenetetrahydromethanopterin reductase
MREVVEAVRLLLQRREPVTYHGQYAHLDRVFLDHDGDGPHDVKIYVAAVGPQMLRLAGRIADGVILNSNHTVAATRLAVEEIRKGAESAGRSLSTIERVKPLPLRVTRDRKAAIQADKLRVAQYIAQQPHIAGPAEVDPELAARLKKLIPWPATHRQVMEGARLVPDRLVESLGCYGDLEEVKDRAREFLDAGVTLPITEADRALVDALAS